MAARKQPTLLSPGDLAPGFRLPKLEGGEVGLADLLVSGPVILVFYKVTCPVCQMALPYLERLRGGSLPIYAISQNDAADTRDFNQEFGVTLPTLLDPEDSFPASNAYGISYVPTTYAIGPDGRITQVIESWDKKELEALAAIAGVQLLKPSENLPGFRAG